MSSSKDEKSSNQDQIISIENVRNHNTSIFSDPDSTDAENKGVKRTPSKKNKLGGMKTTDLKEPISTYMNDQKFPRIKEFGDDEEKLSMKKFIFRFYLINFWFFQ